VTINGDTLAEADESLLVRLSNAVNATIGDGEGIAEVVNDGRHVTKGDMLVEFDQTDLDLQMLEHRSTLEAANQKITKGELAIAGLTNTISMPVNVVPLDGGRVKISGSIVLKMTDFKIEPANIIVVKTSNDVTVKFEWVVGQKKPAAAAK